MDMVPGSPADLQRIHETRGDPRLQIGDKIMTVDGQPISADEPLSAVIKVAPQHVLSVERTLEAPAKAPAPSSPMSPRGLLKAMTPRSSKAEKSPALQPNDKKPWAPTRALKEVRIPLRPCACLARPCSWRRSMSMRMLTIHVHVHARA